MLCSNDFRTMWYKAFPRRKHCSYEKFQRRMRYGQFFRLHRDLALFPVPRSRKERDSRPKVITRSGRIHNIRVWLAGRSVGRSREGGGRTRHDGRTHLSASRTMNNLHVKGPATHKFANHYNAVVAHVQLQVFWTEALSILSRRVRFGGGCSLPPWPGYPERRKPERVSDVSVDD